jgi:hypothetical protein
MNIIHIKNKQIRREKKQTAKRAITADEVIFIFEKVLEGWKTIKIYNTIIQTNQSSNIDKKLTERVASGNCKIYEKELSKERYEYYLNLREKIYSLHNNISNTNM